MIYLWGIIILGIIAYLLSEHGQGFFLKEKPQDSPTTDRFNLVSKQEARLNVGLEYLKKNQEITNEQYREMVGVTRRQAIRDMDLLEKQGLVKQIGKIGKDVKYRFTRP